VLAGDFARLLAHPQPAQDERGDDEARCVDRERPAGPDDHHEAAGQRSEHDLRQHRGGPGGAVRRDDLLVADNRRQHAVGCRVEEHRTGRQPERDRVHHERVVVPDREHDRERGADQVGGDHHPNAREPVDDHAGERGDEQDRQDLGDHDARHTQARAGQPVDQDREGDEAEHVAPLADRARGPQPAELRLRQDTPHPRPALLLWHAPPS
jgi:hypothetical protein